MSTMAQITPIPASNATPSAVVVPPIAAEDHPSWPMSLEVYQRIVEAGILGEHRRVYLWNGRLCQRKSIDRPHGLAVKHVLLALLGLRLDGYDAESEMPMALRWAASAPEPDVKVLRGRCEDYNPRMPTTADVPLVVEVTDSTLSKDRALASTYAVEQVPVYWLLNLPEARLEVYANPVDGVYTSITFLSAEQEVAVVLDGREVGRIRVKDLLP